MKCKKLISLLLVALFMLSAVGCSAFSMNEEKDDESPVLTIDAETIYKKDFKVYRNFQYIATRLSGGVIPAEEQELEQINSNIYNDFVAMQLYKKECEELKIEVDVEEAKKNVPQQIEMYKTQNKDAFDKVLKDYAITEEELIEIFNYGVQLNAYSQAYMADDKVDHTEIAKRTVATVDGVEIPSYVMSMYLAVNMLNQYATTGSAPQSEEEVTALMENAVNDAAKAQAVMTYAENENLKLTEKEIEASLKGLEATFMQFGGEEQFKAMMLGYFVDDELYKEAKTFMGKAAAYETKIVEDIKKSVEPKDSELKKYFEENKFVINDSTVKAYHILTTDKKFAKQMTKEAGNTEEGYMAVYEKYKEDSRVTQAVDLGEFHYSDMIPAFSSEVFGMKKGEVKGNIETEHGYHLVLVYETNYKNDGTFEDNKGLIKEKYIENEVSQTAQETLTEVKDKAKIKLSDDYALMPTEALIENLKVKYNVELFEKNAIR